jgi:hypothetical protein
MNKCYDIYNRVCTRNTYTCKKQMYLNKEEENIC